MLVGGKPSETQLWPGQKSTSTDSVTCAFYTAMLLLSALRQNQIIWKSIPLDGSQPYVLSRGIPTGSPLGWVAVMVQQHLKLVIWECALLSLE